MSEPTSTPAPKVTFYDAPAEGRDERIARLCHAAWERGRRLLVRCSDLRTARRLDTLIWSGGEDTAFVPHELVPPGGELEDAEARIVLVVARDADDDVDPIGAEVLVQETPAPFEVAERYDFVIEIVDHRSPEALEASRARFVEWRERGVRPDFRPG